MGQRRCRRRFRSVRLAAYAGSAPASGEKLRTPRVAAPAAAHADKDAVQNGACLRPKIALVTRRKKMARRARARAPSTLCPGPCCASACVAPGGPPLLSAAAICPPPSKAFLQTCSCASQT
eukprot:15459284-Alexandrium_andersonii.AAC.1